MPIPQCLIGGNLSAIPVPRSHSFSEFQDFGFALTTLWKQSRLFLRAGFQSRSVWAFTAIGDFSGSKAFLEPHPLPHFGPRAFPFFPFRYRVAASQQK